MARPTKLNAERQEKIVQAIRLGATYDLAASYGGVTAQTLSNWMKRGNVEADRREKNGIKEGSKLWNDEQPFFEFFGAIKESEGLAVVGWLAKIEKAASDGTWQAAAWKLERRYPGDYGRSVVDNNTKHSGALKVEIEYIDYNPKTGKRLDDSE